MSQENVDIVRRMLAASDRRDGSAVFAVYDPEIEWDFSDEIPTRPLGSPVDVFGATGVFRGHDAVRRWFRDWFSAWENVDFEHERLIDAGDRVVDFVRAHVRGRESGVEFEFPPYAVVWTLRDGKIVRMKLYWSRQEALEAAGAREWGMSEENVEIVRSIWDAWNRRDYSAALELVAPDIRAEDYALPAGLEATYDGIPGLQKWMARFWGTFVDFHTEIEEYIPVEDEVVFAAHHDGRGKASGAEVEMRNWHVVTVRNGKVVRWRVFQTKPEALEAVGLRE